MILSIQGYLGSFHHIIAQKLFGKDIRVLERDDFSDVFEDTAKGKAAYGIVAIENALTGSILENYDLLLKNKLFIAGEGYLRIAQQLIVWPGTGLPDIRSVHSHPVALRQCRKFLDRHPGWKIVTESDTAGSVKMIRDKKMKNAAAIAGSVAAEIYDMRILAKNIETNKKNYTRFLILSKEAKPRGTADKTSLVFSVRNKPGSLVNVLQIFSDHKINLSKIESRPIIGKVWEYVFYADVEAGLEEKKMKDALGQVKRHVAWIRVLGSYEKGKTFT